MDYVVKWRRLAARGGAGSGLVVDEEGATLGPECLLVRRMPKGYRCIGHAEAAIIAAIIQALLFEETRDPDWLFRRCTRIAAARARGEIALAQIYGLQIPLPDLDDGQLKRLARAAPFVKAGFNPDEPRDRHGRWADGGDAAPQEEREPYGGGFPAGSAADRADGLEGFIRQIRSGRGCRRLSAALAQHPNR